MTPRSYRFGIQIVLGVIALSAMITGPYVLGWFSRSPAPPAAQDLRDASYPLGDFRLVERSGRDVTNADLSERVWIAAFTFTRCPLSCPRISATLKSLQAKLEGTRVRLVSITVDPEFDTPAVLSEYARTYGADPEAWWFVTGEKSAVYDLILKQFRISVATTSEEERKEGAEAVAHSDRLALIGPGNRVMGLFDSKDAAALDALIAQARGLDARLQRPWVALMPKINASLNAACALLLMLGWAAIRSGKSKLHSACMIGGVAVSALFLGCYLVYHWFAGSKTFVGPALPRFVYTTILLSHTLLATFGVVPLVISTLYRASRGTFDRHARVASLTFPIWMYVSITGVVIYWMLYQMTFSTSLAAG
ncbi:MAG: DUF420 domain-containing protein [Isosphaeraceae bacterium]|nr:DUF420 domain-containing protein [Isosphaeraceae bacterium]